MKSIFLSTEYTFYSKKKSKLLIYIFILSVVRKTEDGKVAWPQLAVFELHLFIFSFDLGIKGKNEYFSQGNNQFELYYPTMLNINRTSYNIFIVRCNLYHQSKYRPRIENSHQGLDSIRIESSFAGTRYWIRCK